MPLIRNVINAAFGLVAVAAIAVAVFAFSAGELFVGAFLAAMAVVASAIAVLMWRTR